MARQQLRKMPDGKHTLVCGSTSSGKTSWVRQRIKGVGRVLIWNIKERNEYDAEPIYRKSKLIELAENPAKGKFAFMASSPADFDFFCKVAMHWIKNSVKVHGAKTAIVVEELADVTSPGKAPPGWGELVRKVRDMGCSIYAISQRPAESDKTILGNIALLHCGFLSRFADCKYMAKELNCEPEEISNLKPLEYIERNHNEKTTTRGKVCFGRTGKSGKK